MAFKEIQKAIKKGGIKPLTVVNADDIEPSLVWFSEAKIHKHDFLER